MITSLINQEDITIIRMYVLISNNRAPKYVKQKLTELKAEIRNLTTIVRDFNTQFSVVGKPTR